MRMEILVQKRDELNAGKAIEFIENCEKAKLAIVHSSVKDEIVSLDFFDTLVRRLKSPFVGMKVSGTVTNQGYSEDSVAVAVLCGDFSMSVFHKKIDYEKPASTAELVIPKLKGSKLCLVYSANPLKRVVFVDSVLRKIQNANQDLQIFGGLSAYPPVIVTNDGIFEDSIVFVAMNGLSFDFQVGSGFRFTESDKKVVVTKSDDCNIYEINGRNASEEYSKIQHIRPYFQNMLAGLLVRSDVSELLKKLSKSSSIMYDSVVKTCIKGLGYKITEDVIAPFAVLQMEKDYLRTTGYISSGTILKEVNAPLEEQLEVYDRIHEKFPDAESMLVHPCVIRKFWSNFDYDGLEKRVNGFKFPVLVSYTHGEFGTYLPYEGLEHSVAHGGLVKALIFR